MLLTEVLVSGDNAGTVTDSPFASVGERPTILSLYASLGPGQREEVADKKGDMESVPLQQSSCPVLKALFPLAA